MGLAWNLISWKAKQAVRPRWAKFKTSLPQKKKKIEGWGCSLEVECLPSMCKTWV